MFTLDIFKVTARTILRTFKKSLMTIIHEIPILASVTWHLNQSGAIVDLVVRDFFDNHSDANLLAAEKD